MTELEWVRSNKLTELEQNYPWPTGAIVFDTETTGLHPYERPNEYAKYYSDEPAYLPPDDILQLSIISAHNGRTLFNKRLWPAHNRAWPQAEKIHGIRPIDVRDAPSFYEVRDKVQEIIDGARLIIGYNLCFDMSFLKMAGISFDKCKWAIDVMDDFAAHYGERPEWAQDYTWQKLTKAARLTGYDPYYWDPNLAGTGYDAHDSLNDCKATLHVARWLEENPKQMLQNALYY